MSKRPNRCIPLERRLRYTLDETTGCWLWPGEVNNKGYPRMWVEGRRMSGHRAVYELFKGPLGPGQVVMHECDTPRCINPDHLILGTQLENLADMRAKGRGTAPPVHRGESHHKAKLTERQVREMRARYAGGGVSQRVLALEYGVSQTSIKDVLLRRTWSDVA